MDHKSPLQLISSFLKLVLGYINGICTNHFKLFFVCRFIKFSTLWPYLQRHLIGWLIGPCMQALLLISLVIYNLVLFHFKWKDLMTWLKLHIMVNYSSFAKFSFNQHMIKKIERHIALVKMYLELGFTNVSQSIECKELALPLSPKYRCFDIIKILQAI